MNETRVKQILLAAGSAALLAFCLAPFAYMLLTSLSENPGFPARGAAFGLTARHYAGVLGDADLHFMDYLKNSLLVSGAAALAAVWIASLAAYAIVQLKAPGARAVLFSALVASMFPQISLVSFLFKFMTGLGWINTLPALVLPYIAWALPLTLWILTGTFAQIPAELDQAASVDGASPVQRLRKIVFPVAAPGLLSAGLLCFIFCFNEFLFALMLTTDHHARTVPVGIALFQGLHGRIPWGPVMAASALTTLPVIALALCFQRRIVQGLTRGSVKG